MDIGEQFRKGAFWIYLQSWISTVFTFAAGMIMARLLTPADFGIFAVVTAITSLLGKQVRFGLPEALMRTESTDRESVDAAFWLMLGMAGVCAFVVIISADAITEFYHDSRAYWLYVGTGLLLLLQPPSIVAQNILRRDMRQDIVERIILVANLATLPVSLYAAYAGAGPYALLAGNMIGTMVQLLLSMIYARWFPRLAFAASAARRILSYGWRMHILTSLALASNKVDAMILGRIAGTSILGLYNRAANTARLPEDELLQRLYTLILPAFFRLSGESNRTTLAVQKLITPVTTTIYLFLAMIAVSPEPFLHLLYGSQWVSAAPALTILTIAVAISTLKGISSMIAGAQGHVGRQIPVELFNLVITVVFVLSGAMLWGLLGVAWSMVLRNAMVLLLWLFVVTRHLHFSAGIILVASLPAICAFGVTMALSPKLLLFVPGLEVVHAGIASRFDLPERWIGYLETVVNSTLGESLYHLCTGFFLAFVIYVLAWLIVVWPFRNRHVGIQTTFELVGSVFGRLSRLLLPKTQIKKTVS